MKCIHTSLCVLHYAKLLPRVNLEKKLSMHVLIYSNNCIINQSKGKYIFMAHLANGVVLPYFKCITIHKSNRSL